MENLRTIKLEKQNSQFPPKNTWLIEGSDYYHKLWASHLETGRLYDRRTTRKTVQHNTDSDQWSYIVSEHESVKVVDQETGDLVLLVLRQFCNDYSTLGWVNGVCEHGLELKKSVRLDDTGKIVMVGHTAGSRCSPSIMWSKNLLKNPTRDRARVD